MDYNNTCKEKYSSYDYIQKNRLHKTSVYAGIGALTGILAIITYIILHFAISDKSISDVYVDNIFYYINYPFRKISEYVPFSVAELLLYIFIIAFLVFFIKTIYRTVVAVMLYFRMKKEGHYPEKRFIFCSIENFALRTSGLICCLIAIFIFFGGINYTGMSFTEKSGYELNSYSVSQLSQLCYYLSQSASNTRIAVETLPNGTIDENYHEYNPYKLADNAIVAYNRLPDEYNSHHIDYPAVKFAYSSVFMSNIHITGIYPYLFPESVVNIDTPIMSLPHTICHEMAHQRGFAREDEANFIGYMACLQSDNPLFAYSAYYTAFTYAMAELYIYDAEAWNAIINLTSKDVLDDISREKAYWSQFQTISNEVTTNLNNTYLNIMDVEDGVKSYGRMIELLLAESIRSGIIK